MKRRTIIIIITKMIIVIIITTTIRRRRTTTTIIICKKEGSVLFTVMRRRTYGKGPLRKRETKPAAKWVNHEGSIRRPIEPRADNLPRRYISLPPVKSIRFNAHIQNKLL